MMIANDKIDVTTAAVAANVGSTALSSAISLDGGTSNATHYVISGGVLTFTDGTNAINPLATDIATIIAAVEGIVTNEAVAVQIDLNIDGTNDSTLLVSEHSAGVEASFIVVNLFELKVFVTVVS